MPPLERTKALKIRQGRGEDKVLTQFSLNLSRVSLLLISNLHYEGPKPSFYWSTGHLQSLFYKLPKLLLHSRPLLSSLPKLTPPTKLTPQASRISCSVRLTWDVFVRDLNRQLGTPSHRLPV